MRVYGQKIIEKKIVVKISICIP